MTEKSKPPVVADEPPVSTVDPVALQAEIDRLREVERANMAAEIERLRGLVPVEAAPVPAEPVNTVPIADVGPGGLVELQDGTGTLAIVTGPSQVLILGVPQTHECDVVELDVAGLA